MASYTYNGDEDLLKPVVAERNAVVTGVFSPRKYNGHAQGLLFQQTKPCRHGEWGRRLEVCEGGISGRVRHICGVMHILCGVLIALMWFHSLVT